MLYVPSVFWTKKWNPRRIDYHLRNTYEKTIKCENEGIGKLPLIVSAAAAMSSSASPRCTKLHRCDLLCLVLSIFQKEGALGSKFLLSS